MNTNVLMHRPVTGWGALTDLPSPRSVIVKEQVRVLATRTANVTLPPLCESFAGFSRKWRTTAGRPGGAVGGVVTGGGLGGMVTGGRVVVVVVVGAAVVVVISGAAVVDVVVLDVVVVGATVVTVVGAALVVVVVDAAAEVVVVVGAIVVDVVSSGELTAKRSAAVISGTNVATALDTCCASDGAGAGLDRAAPAPTPSATTTAVVATALNRIFIPLCRFPRGA